MRITPSTVLFIALFPIIMLLLFVYPIFRVASWIFWKELRTHHYFYALFIGIPLLILIPVVIGRYLRNHNTSYLRWANLTCGNYIFFIPLTLFLWCILGEIVELLGFIRALNAIHRHRRILGFVVLALGLITYVYGIINGHIIITKTIELPSPLSHPVVLVQISDTHIGTFSKKSLQRVVHKVNQLNPDIVVITGDVVDSKAVLDIPEGIGRNTLFGYGTARCHDLDCLSTIEAHQGVYVVSVCPFFLWI